MFTILVCVGLSVCQPIQTWLSNRAQYYSRYVPRGVVPSMLWWEVRLHYNEMTPCCMQWKSFCPCLMVWSCVILTRKCPHVCGLHLAMCLSRRDFSPLDVCLRGKVLEPVTVEISWGGCVSAFPLCQLLHLYCMLDDLYRVECVLCIVLPVKIISTTFWYGVSVYCDDGPGSEMWLTYR